jgi:hypothetical protein
MRVDEKHKRMRELSKTGVQADGVMSLSLSQGSTASAQCGRPATSESMQARMREHGQ